MRAAAGIGLIQRQPAYRCRHGYTSATRPDPTRPKNLYIREDKILPRLAALAILHASGANPPANSKRSRAAITPPTQAADLTGHLRATSVSLIYHPASHVLRTSTQDAIPVSVG